MSQNYWENRYQTKDMPWEKGAPSPGLVDFLAENQNLPRGTVCVPGCGTGHDAREWAKARFNPDIALNFAEAKACARERSFVSFLHEQKS